MKWGSLVAVAVVGGIGCILTLDRGVAQDLAAVVKERREIMNSLWPKYYAGFTSVARGQSTDIAPFPQKAQDAVADLRKVATLFPPGTARDAIPGTRAKPEIWSQKADFDAALAKLIEETERLATISRGGNIDAVKAQIAVMSQACGGCHTGNVKGGGTYRFEVP